MIERAHAVRVGNIPGAGSDQQIDDLLLHRTAVTKDYRLHQRCPAEIVDVVDIDIGREQDRHGFRIAVIRGRDQKAVPPKRLVSFSLALPVARIAFRISFLPSAPA